MPATSSSPPSIVLRVHRPSDNNEPTQEDHVTDALSAVSTPSGITLGNSPQATFKLHNDPDVDAIHGTFERTSGRGVWVYSDHSSHGSTLNNTQKVHNGAVIVRHGDTLKLGQTEIQVCLNPLDKTQKDPQEEDDEDDDEEEKEVLTSLTSNQDSEFSARNAAKVARRRASTPWNSAGTKAQQVKKRLPRIETSGPGFVDPVETIATPPEYTASPVQGTRCRRKRNSIATTTLMAGKRSPSPPLDQQGHPHSFHRPRTRFVQGETSSTPPERKAARPPPLEYSSSPMVSPSSLARQRHNLFQQPPNSNPTPGTGMIAGIPPPPISVGARPTSRRDDLRIQVSKKMAAAAPVSIGKTAMPRVAPKPLEFQAPASPVAQRDILKQQESLQTILQHKFEEEQLLKQQQEEWMRQNLMSDDSEHRSRSPKSTPPLSPIKSERKSLKIDPDELPLFPAPAPIHLRTLSLGISEQRLKPSPRLSAAIRASRSRLNKFEEGPLAPQRGGRMGRRQTTALVLSPSVRMINSSEYSSPIKEIKENELRTSDESVASTATTILTCHRRVTSSLSSDSASSVDLCDFVGYEEEEDAADAVKSYTTPDMYGSAELLRSSGEDTTLLYDVNRNSRGSSNSLYGTLSPPPSNAASTISPSNAGDTCLGSPRRQGTETPDTSSSSSNRHDNSPVPSFDKKIALGSRVLSPRGGQFDPRSPYKSAAALKNNLQLPPPPKLRRPAAESEDADESEEASELRQFKPQPFRRRASFRRHSLNVPSFSGSNDAQS